MLWIFLQIIKRNKLFAEINPIVRAPNAIHFVLKCDFYSQFIDRMLFCWKILCLRRFSEILYGYRFTSMCVVCIWLMCFLWRLLRCIAAYVYEHICMWLVVYTIQCIQYYILWRIFFMSLKIYIYLCVRVCVYANFVSSIKPTRKR